MSTVVFRHEYSNKYKEKGVSNTIKENLIDGEKGLSIMFLHKEGEKKFYKVYIKETSKDKFDVEEKKDDKETADTHGLAVRK